MRRGEQQKILHKGSNDKVNVFITLPTSLPDIPLSLESIVDETINDLNSSLGDFKLKESKLFLLNNYNSVAHKLVYSYIQSNKKVNNMDIGLIANNNLFLLSFVSSSDIYNKYLPTIEKMVETFEIYISDDYTLDRETFLNKLFSPISTNASALGDAESKITIVEFGDYQDQVSTQFHHETMDAIIQKFVLIGFTMAITSIVLITVGNNAFAIEYTNEKCGVSIQYPEEWEVENQDYKNDK